VKKNNQIDFGVRRETGELYMLSKKERVLTIGVIKMTLATKGGREFLLERFGKEGLKMALGLFEEMGVQFTPQQGQKRKSVS